MDHSNAFQAFDSPVAVQDRAQGDSPQGVMKRLGALGALLKSLPDLCIYRDVRT